MVEDAVTLGEAMALGCGIGLTLVFGTTAVTLWLFNRKHGKRK